MPRVCCQGGIEGGDEAWGIDLPRIESLDLSRAEDKRFHIEKGMSLVHLCVQFCNNAALRLLIENQADVNHKELSWTMLDPVFAVVTTG